MKNLILIISCLLVVQSIKSQDVKIVAIGSSYDQCKGWIKMQSKGPLAPFTITIIRQDGWTTSVSGINGEYTFFNLCQGVYKIYAEGIRACPYEFNATVNSCESFKVDPKIIMHCVTKKSGENPFIEKKGSIVLNILGGVPPLTYEWRDKNKYNQIISTSKDLFEIVTGVYSVIVKDKIGCMYTNTFTIGKLYLSTTNNFSKNYCYTQSDFTIEMDPIAIMNYKWSNGIIQNDYIGRARLSNDITQKHSVTITEPTSKCQIIEDLYVPRGTWYWEIKGFKNPSSIGVKDGWVDLVENLTGFSGFIPDPQKIVIMRNGVLYRESIYSTGPSREFRVNSLEEGDYIFYWKDNKDCDIAAQSIVLYACNGGLHNPSIEITNFALPPSSPNSYVEAIASYQYGSINECKYNWYSSFYNVTTTLVPRLTNAELKKFYSSTTGDLCVKMICPCGEAKSCVKFNPCHPDARFVYTKRDINSVCYGVLPTGKAIVYKPKGKIDLEIDVNRYMDIGDQGLAEYNKRIASIRWEDGATLFKQFQSSSNLLKITREVDAAGDYNLIVVTGTGCTISERIRVDNSFEINHSVDDKCIYRAKCKEDGGIGTLYNEGRLLSINFETCEAYVFCGENIIEKVSGFSRRGEYVSSPPLCKAKQYCIFYTINSKLNEVNNPDLLIHYTDPSNKELSPRIYAAVREVVVDCCTGLGKDKIINNLKLINDYEENVFIHVDLNNNSLNPCVGYALCDNGYYQTIIGTITNGSDYICKEKDGSCKRCITCSFNHSEVDFTLKERCYTVNTSECDDKVPCPSVLIQGDSTMTRSKGHYKIKISPNPFNDILLIKNSIPFSKSVKCFIEILNASGKVVEKNSIEFSAGEEVKFIDTKNISAGFYIFKCHFENEQTQTFKMIKI